MQQFTVPQFIDVEAKVIGPITSRQFIIILAGFIIISISYKLFDFSLFLTIAILTLIISGTFAFAKINGRPFHFFILNFIQTIKRAKLRVWNNAVGKIDYDYEKDETETAVEILPPSVKHYTTSRLAELSLIVDTGGAYRGEEEIDSAEIKTI
jgi:hypothetical protein